MNQALLSILVVVFCASVILSQSTPATTVNFPPKCAAECTAFGNALQSNCVTPATTVSETSTKIGLCFCTQYGSSGGVSCLTCIGNQYPDNNSSKIFMNLGTACSTDGTGSAAGLVVSPIIKDTVSVNAVTNTTGSSTKTSTSTKTDAGAAVVVVAAVTPTKSSSTGGKLDLVIGGSVLATLIAAIIFTF